MSINCILPAVPWNQWGSACRVNRRRCVGVPGEASLQSAVRPRSRWAARACPLDGDASLITETRVDRCTDERVRGCKKMGGPVQAKAGMQGDKY